MEDINLSSDDVRREFSDGAHSNHDHKRSETVDAEGIQAKVDRGMVGFWTVASCCIALWTLASRMLSVVFACSVVAALAALWITVSVAFVIHGVITTLWSGRDHSQGRG